ncbi:hypothetical protein [Roseicyclus persicicus]|uniref:Uncharacterized protein n=1 Tax=Roseicyclus persicicus TaxID=2650661 RepID=A0A7X6GXE1_9RHOB|nr:hypothetical protein [Roseibacterium persicicum]NKX43061.1 hypothetical protein [Roseibacterium persicicum]
MKPLFLATAAALALAAPVAAQTQLETTLGVTPGTFTAAELADLNRAYEENDQTRIDFILSGGSNLDAATIERLGVQQAIARAVEEGDYAQARNLQAARGVSSDTSVASSRGETVATGWLQSVADDLGVDARDFSRGDLLALARSVEEGDRVAVTGILSRVQN